MHLVGPLAQHLTHALHQQPVAPVLQNGQRQRALQHQAQRTFVASQWQRQVLGIEAEACLLCVEAHRARKQYRIDASMFGWREGKSGFQQGDT